MEETELSKKSKGAMDLCSGNIWKTAPIFAYPIILSTLLQNCFNAADKLVLGQMGGTVALAAVGACSAICALVLNTFIGFSAGVNVVMARYVGAKDEEECKKTVNSTILFSFGLGILAVFLGFIIAKPLLVATECPEECLEDAIIYTKIYFVGVPFNIIYNFGSALLRTSGDSKRPSNYLIIAGITNVVLNVLLCLVMDNKVAAVAIATSVSHFISAILVLLRLTRMEESYRLNPKSVQMSWEKLKKIVRYGIPSALTHAAFPLANLQVSAATNSFGAAAVAGSGVGGTIDTILSAITAGFNHTTLAMMGQNLGAGKNERIKKIFSVNLIYCVGITIVFSGICVLFRKPITQLFVPGDEEALEYAMVRILTVELLYFIPAIYNIFANGLNAFGYTHLTMIDSMLSIVVFRTFWMQVVFQKYHTFFIAVATFPVSWVLECIGHILMFLYVWNKFKKGKIHKL